MRILTMLVLAVSFVACTGEAQKDTLRPEVIKVGVLPDQEGASLIAKYSPLLDYLSTQTGLEIELELSADYTTMLDDFHAHRIHIANFGGLTFTEAERRDNAEPLVMRDADLNFASCYLVQSADIRKTVREFDGETFAFGPQLSTSGHLMPRYFLQADGLDPETFFASVQHTSGHDETAMRVRDGAVDIGVANCVIVTSMYTDGRLRPNEVRVLETTPAYANYVWAIHENMDSSIKMRLRDAFLALDVLIPEHQEILRNLGANAYLPASRADFNEVRGATRAIRFAATPGQE